MHSFFQIPGFREAYELQNAARELPFVGVPVKIAGADIPPLTLRRYTILSRAGSPWIVGGVPTAEDALVFLWVASTDYEFAKPPSKRFMKRFAKHWNKEEREKLDEYVELVFADSTGGGGDNSIPTTSAAASYVHVITKAYGWTRDVILDTPIAELNQYVRRINMDLDGGAITFNRITDKVKGDWLRRLNEVPPEDREAWMREQHRRGGDN